MAKTDILADCTIVLSGTFEGYTQGSLSKLIKENGGKYGSKLTGASTQLVCSEKEWVGTTQGRGTKVKQASDLSDIKIVSLDWLLKSVEEGEKLDEDKYLMANSNSATVKDEDVEDEDVKDEDVKDDKVKKSDAGKKRTRNGKVKAASPESDGEEQKPPAKKQKDSQKAKSGNLNIPIDEGCNLQGSHRVHVDDDGTIFDASLNQTNSTNNNNKFYRIQLLGSHNGDFRTWTRWGRVGEHGQSAMLGGGDLDDACKQFEKKFKDKSGLAWKDRLSAPKKGKYKFIERNYEDDSSDDDDLPGAGSRGVSKASVKSEERKKVESTLALPTQSLMELIFNQQYFAATMTEMDYDAEKLPLGKLGKRTLKKGYQALKDLAELLANPALADEVHNMTFNDALEEISNDYYSFIPHAFGRNRPPIIRDDVRLKKEILLLESLSDMEIANDIMKEAKEDVGDLIHPLDRQYAGLGMAEMTHLEPKSTEFQALSDYLLKTHGSTHYFQFKIESIFRIERLGEGDRFSKSPFASLPQTDRRLLWHGSRATNFGGILSQGLRIAPPEAPVSGYMFGKGVYLADISSKSAGYTAYHSSGGVGLLLLCEAELGKPMLELTGADSNAGEEAKRQGRHATWGKGMTAPVGWKDAGCVNKSLQGVMMPDTSHPPGDSGVDGANLQYNEFICYDVAQIRLRYLFRVKVT